MCSEKSRRIEISGTTKKLKTNYLVYYAYFSRLGSNKRALQRSKRKDTS